MLSALGPIATGLAALVALIVGTVTIAQRSRADRCDQWWKRAQWAIDAMFDAAEKRRKVASLVADELGNEGDTDGVEESDTGDR